MYDRLVKQTVRELGRVGAILAAPEAKGRDRFAMQLATRTEFSIGEARAALAALPIERAKAAAKPSAKIAAKTRAKRA